MQPALLLFTYEFLKVYSLVSTLVVYQFSKEIVRINWGRSWERIHVSLGISNETSWVPSKPCQLSEWMILIQCGPFFIMFRFSCLNLMLTATKEIKVLWALITSLKFRPASSQQLDKENVYTLQTLKLLHSCSLWWQGVALTPAALDSWLESGYLIVTQLKWEETVSLPEKPLHQNHKTSFKP